MLLFRTEWLHACQYRDTGRFSGKYRRCLGGEWNRENHGNTETVTVPEGRWVKGRRVNAGKWWWLNPNGSYPIHTWRWLDGNQDGVAECYYFDDNGWAVTSGLTPDGFWVNAEGAWVENQVVKTKKKKRREVVDPPVSGGGTSGKTGSGGGGSSSGGGSHGGSHRYEDDDDDEWDDYADGSVSGSANDFKTANFGMMTSSQWKETKSRYREIQTGIYYRWHE